MAKKYDIPRRKRAILRTLERTGNLTLAAEKARVARNWVERHRQLDPAFDADCRSAIAAAKDRLAKLDGTAPPTGWGSLDGAELVVRGAPGRRVQIRRARADGWSPAVERRFLQTLASTCNVRAACAEVGMCIAAAYHHRKRWPAFERAWDEAVETGYAHLESALVERALNLFSSDEPAVPGELGDMTAAQAVHLLHMHKHQVHGIGKGPRPKLRSSLEEATARLEKALNAMRVRDELDEADKARREREWAARRPRS